VTNTRMRSATQKFLQCNPITGVCSPHLGKRKRGMNLAARSIAMLIHFKAERGARCDDCGNPHTMMHIWAQHLDRSVNLCVGCFRALTKALSQASAKLQVGEQSDIVRKHKGVVLFRRDHP
jgi:hypothetical protein